MMSNTQRSQDTQYLERAHEQRMALQQPARVEVVRIGDHAMIGHTTELLESAAIHVISPSSGHALHACNISTEPTPVIVQLKASADGI